jgi:hypothetical protein
VTCKQVAVGVAHVKDAPCAFPRHCLEQPKPAPQPARTAEFEFDIPIAVQPNLSTTMKYKLKSPSQKKQKTRKNRKIENIINNVHPRFHINIATNHNWL